MKPSDFIEAYCALRGTNPRPQPWQMELVDRLWAKRLERQRQGKFTPLVPHSTSNWGSGGRWFYDYWMKQARESSPFRSFFVGADTGTKPDRTTIVAMKHEGPRRETLIFLDEVGCWPERLRADVKEERISDREAALKLAMSMITISAEPKKKRVPFYTKFQPKRRLT